MNKAILYYTPLKEKYIYYVKALDVLEPYLSEPLKTEFDRETVFLGSEIIARFRSYIDDYQIYCQSKKIKAMIVLFFQIWNGCTCAFSKSLQKPCFLTARLYSSFVISWCAVGGTPVPENVAHDPAQNKDE